MAASDSIQNNGVIKLVDKFPDGKYFLQKSFIDFGYDLTVTNTKLLESLFVVMSQYKIKDAIYRIKVKDIIGPFNFDEKVAYTEIHKATKARDNAINDMVNWRIVIKIDKDETTGEEAWRYIPILKDATYHPGKAMIDLRINDALEKYWYNDVNEDDKIHFDIDEMYCFELVRSHKMYQVLKRYAYDSLTVTFTLDEIRRFFDKENEYLRWPDLKRRIVEPIMLDILENGRKPKSISEFTFTYEPIKEGRAVTKVEFILQPIEGRFKGSKTPIIDVVPIEDIIDLEPLRYLEPKLQQYGFYLRTLNEIAQNQDNLIINPKLPEVLGNPEYIENLLKYLDKTYIKKDKPVTGGLIRKGLINGWGQPTVSEKKAEINKHKRQEEKQKINQDEESINKLLEKFNLETSRLVETKKEKLSPEEIEQHFTNFINSSKVVDNGFIKNFIEDRLALNHGVRDLGIKNLFNDYLKEILLSPEENDFIQWAKKQGYNNIIQCDNGYTFQMELFAV